MVALGLAVNHLMTKPAFASLQFGDWSRILVGQINRGHYYFVVDNNNKIYGFVGWALTTKEKAEVWVEGRRGLSYEDSKEGDCLVFNAWSANSTQVHRYLVDEVRKIIKDKQTVYFKRYYKDGRIRPIRLTVNDFVINHINRQASALAARSTTVSNNETVTPADEKLQVANVGPGVLGQRHAATEIKR